MAGRAHNGRAEILRFDRRADDLRSDGPARDLRGGDHEIARLGPWFHNLHLPDGRETCPDHPLGDFPSFKWTAVARALPEELSGWTVLDIGCNAGFYSIALAERGAEVLGIDHDPHYLAQARWAVRRFGLERRVTLERREVYALGELRRTFDLVLFMGVFYHLRYPLLGLDLAAEKTARLMVFQTLSLPGRRVSRARDVALGERARLERPGWPRMAFIEESLAGDPTNWWVPNHACVLAMLRTAGLAVVGQPGHEIYLCEPAASLRLEPSSSVRHAVRRRPASTTDSGRR